jgi:hypothetical protein
MTEEIAEDAAEHGRDRRDDGVAVDPIRPGEAHRHEQDFGRDHEHRAFDERDEGEPPLRAFARGK